MWRLLILLAVGGCKGDEPAPEECPGDDSAEPGDTGCEPGTWLVDGDGDGYGRDEVVVEGCGGPGLVSTGGDCDDLDAAVHPGATEDPCNAVDDDCSGVADDGAACDALPGDPCVLDEHCAAVAGGTTACVGGACALACAAGYALELDGLSCAECIPEEPGRLAREVWTNLQRALREQLDQVEGTDGTVLYNVQVWTSNLLHMADLCEDQDLLDELAELALVGWDHATTLDGHPTWVDGTGAEVGALNMSQWMFWNTNLLRALGEVPESERTEAMAGLLARAPEMGDILRRYALDDPIFDVHGWGCDGGRPLAPTGGTTLTAWVQTEDTDGVVAIRSGTYYQLGLEGGKIAGRVVLDEPDVAAGTPYTVVELTGSKKVNDGDWHHLALVLEPDAALTLVVDGSAQAAVAVTGDVKQGATAWVGIGGYDYGSGSCCFLDGAIRQVRLYGRALDAGEIATVMACLDRWSCDDPALLAYWPLDDGPDDELGRFPLVDGASDGTTFDGETDNLRTHDYSGAQTHLWALRGMAREALADSDDDPDYCHGLRDVDLWLLAATAELLTARQDLGETFDLSENDARRLADYLDEGLDLVESRLDRRELTDWEGGATTGLVLDKGYWDQHTEREYSGYDGEDFPTEDDRSVVPAAGMDLSHGRRLVHVFAALHADRAVTGRSFPDDEVMAGLARQFAYASFAGDLSAPLFHNFMGGANGWYRWGYDGREGFGYEPYDLSVAGLTGGYGFWGVHEPDVRTVNLALWDLVGSAEPEVEAFRDEHYGRYWWEWERTGGISVDPADSYELLQFAPTFAVGPD